MPVNFSGEEGERRRRAYIYQRSRQGSLNDGSEEDEDGVFGEAAADERPTKRAKKAKDAHVASSGGDDDGDDDEDDCVQLEWDDDSQQLLYDVTCEAHHARELALKVDIDNGMDIIVPEVDWHSIAAVFGGSKLLLHCSSCLSTSEVPAA